MGIKMGIVDVRISVPEAVNAISKFKESRLQALNELTSDIKSSVSVALNDLLQTEMTIFLGQASEKTNKRNGFKEKDYTIKGIGTVRLKVPQDRQSNFNSVIIPKNETIDPRLKEDIAVLHLAGISTRVMAMISKRLLGLDVSSKTVSRSLDIIEYRALEWLQRPLTKKYWALYVDGTYFKVQRRGSTEAEPSLVVLGIDEDNKRSILAIEPGFKDSADAWKGVFSSLIERGLNISEVKLGIMDGLPGLERVFKEVFSNSVTQRCWVHSLSNALSKAPKRLQVPFKELAHQIMYASSKSDAEVALNQLKESMGTDARRAVDTIEKDIDSLLTFFNFDKSLWSALRTSNSIERVNKEFKRRTKSMGTIGEKTLEVLLAFTALKLEQGWQKNAVNAKQYNNLSNVRNTVEASCDVLLKKEESEEKVLKIL